MSQASHQRSSVAEAVEPEKPYHEMTLEEYSAKAHSQSVPRWSILAINPDTYTAKQLCHHGRDALSAFAQLWGVKRDGTKQEIADRIIRRVQFRSMMAKETETSLAARPRKELAAIATEAGVYHPWLNRKALAAVLIQWREDSRRNVRLQIAKANHERLVQTAARKGVHVPEANLRMYGLDREGHYEPTILGVALSQAIRCAPEAVEAARTLTAPAFREWLAANPDLSSKLVFIQPGILGDGGHVFWREAQHAYTSPEVPPLFKNIGVTGAY
jgi:hypothetical protein